MKLNFASIPNLALSETTTKEQPLSQKAMILAWAGLGSQLTQQGPQLVALVLVGVGQCPPDHPHRHDVSGILGSLWSPGLEQPRACSRGSPSLG